MSLLRQALVRFGDDPNGWLLTSSLWLSHALARPGTRQPDGAAFATMQAARHPGFRFLDPAILLAEAWLNAAEGAISSAITLAGRSAQLCRDRAQPGSRSSRAPGSDRVR